MRNPTDPGDGALDPKPVSGMDEVPVLAKIQVPAVGLGVETLLDDAGEELIVAVLSLRPTDDLAVSFGSEAVVVEDGPGVLGILLHVKGLDLLGIVIDEDGSVELPGQQSFVVATKIAAPANIGAERIESGDGVGVGD